MTHPYSMTVVTNSTSSAATARLQPARACAERRIDHNGFIDSTKAAIEICALVSNERMLHSLNAIACLRKSIRSSLPGTLSSVFGCCPPTPSESPDASPLFMEALYWH